MSLLVISDLHLGCNRRGGTTQASQQALRAYMMDRLNSLLALPYDDALIAGDLFDAFDVDNQTVLSAYMSLGIWADRPGRHLYLMAGNHDENPRDTKISSFHLLGSLLRATCPGNVSVIANKGAELGDGTWVVPHMANQDAFDLELSKWLAKAEEFPALRALVLHANYANKFAEHADHSLSVSREMAKRFVDAGVTLVFAHEHVAKQDFDGRVWVMGNQFCSSISDCLGNDDKFAHVISHGVISTIPTWSRTGPNGYEEMDWRDLHESDAKFIRIVGSATAEEAEAVVEAVAKYRAKSEAFVVGNAVVVDGLAAMDALEEASAETIKSFDVMSALLSYLNEEEQVAVRGLV